MNDEKQRFLHELKVALQQNAPGRAFDVAEAGDTVRFGDGTSINLANIFKSWARADEERRALIVSNVLAMVRELSAPRPAQLAEVSLRLCWRVRDLASRQLVALHLLAEGSEPRRTLERPLGDHLRATVVIDSEELMTDVSPELLEKWGCDAAAVFAAAQRNLEALESPFTSPWPGVYLVEHDNYAASAVLRAEAQALVVQGRPLAFLAHRSLLLITGDADEDGLLRVVERLEAEFDAPYAISIRSLVFDGSTWVTHRLPADTPATVRLESLRLRELAGIYQQERKLLQARSEEAFVATYTVITTDERVSSYAVWSKGVHTLLPETELIVFCVNEEYDGRPFWKRLWPRKKDWSAMVPFERVRQVVGHRMERQADPVTRYRVNSFPTKAEFEEMGVTDAPADQLA